MRAEVMTKDKHLFESNHVYSINLKTPKGEVTLLNHHINYISQVVPGKVTIKHKEKEEFEVVVDKGFIQAKDNQVTILLQQKYMDVKQTEIELIENAMQNAYDFIQEKQKAENIDYALLLGNIERELLKLKKLK